MKPTEFITEASLIAQEADDMHADHEVQMARSDCYNAAKYAIDLHKILKQMSSTHDLEGWVSEKITLANDYLRTVHEYLMYEEVAEPAMMDFNESTMDFAVEKLISETADVTDYNPKSQGGTRKELLANYAKSGSATDATAARKAGATQKELQAARKNVSEDATGGSSCAGGMAITMTGGGSHKPGTGKPKKVGNTGKMKAYTVGKGVY